MNILERHVSRDGSLTLVVNQSDQWTIGFDDCPWHTHGDMLSALGYGGTAEEAARSFVRDIIESRLPIVTWRLGNKVRDYDIPLNFDLDELRTDLKKYGESGETVDIRYWNGNVVASL